MRRFLFLAIAAGLAVAPACGPPFPPFPPDLVTVKGQVVAGGVGVQNAVVYAIDRTADAGPDAAAPFATLTDGTGHFAYYGFGSTYDVLVSPPGSPNDLTLVRGLTRRDPVISLPLPKNAPVYTASLSPKWSPAPPDGSKIAYFLSGPTYPGTQLVGVTQASGDPNGTLTATWRGGASTTTNIWAVVYFADSSSGAPTTWLGYGTVYTFLIDQRLQAFTITYQSTSSSQATLQVHAPEGYAVSNASIGIDFGYETTGTTFFQVASPQGASTFDLPNVPFNRIVAAANAGEGGASATAFALGSVAEGQNASMTIDLPIAPGLASPDDGATIDAAATFSVSSNAVQEITLTPADASAPKVRFITTDPSVSLSDVTALSGTTLPAGAHYTWRSTRWRDFPSTDAFEAVGVDLPKASFGTSETRSFTVASP